MNALANQLQAEINRNQKLATDDKVREINTLRPGAGFDHQAVQMNHGDLTWAGLEAVEENVHNRRVNDVAMSSVRAVAGMAQEKAPTLTEKERARISLIKRMKENGTPERLFTQICAGVCTINPKSGRPYVDPNLGFWLAQQITNQVCRMAGNAIIERKNEVGIIAGINLTKDDTGMWDGVESTNTDDLNIARGGQRSTDNLFLQHCDDEDTIVATFNEWYESIELALSALSGVTVMQGGGIMQYGHFSRWEDSDAGLTQVIDTLDTYVARELVRRNDNNSRDVVPTSTNELDKLFG